MRLTEGSENVSCTEYRWISGCLKQKYMKILIGKYNESIFTKGIIAILLLDCL